MDLKSNFNCVKKSNTTGDYTVPHDFDLKRNEKKIIKACLLKLDGNVKQCAAKLGIGRITLYKKITDYGLDLEKYRDLK